MHDEVPLYWRRSLSGCLAASALVVTAFMRSCHQKDPINRVTTSALVAKRRFSNGDGINTKQVQKHNQYSTYAIGSIRATYQKYPGIGPVLPAMGYGPDMIEELERRTINVADANMVLVGTPIDLGRFRRLNKPRAARPLRLGGDHARHPGRPAARPFPQALTRTMGRRRRAGEPRLSVPR